MTEKQLKNKLLVLLNQAADMKIQMLVGIASTKDGDTKVRVLSNLNKNKDLLDAMTAVVNKKESN